MAVKSISVTFSPDLQNKSINRSSCTSTGFPIYALHRRPKDPFREKSDQDPSLLESTSHFPCSHSRSWSPCSDQQGQAVHPSSPSSCGWAPASSAPSTSQVSSYLRETGFSLLLSGMFSVPSHNSFLFLQLLVQPHWPSWLVYHLSPGTSDRFYLLVFPCGSLLASMKLVHVLCLPSFFIEIYTIHPTNYFYY